MDLVQAVRACTSCQTAKPFSEFYLDPRGQAHRPHCKECMRSAQRQRPRKNRDPAKKAEYRRRMGQASGPYVPKAEQMAIAAEKRSALQAKHEGAAKARQARRSLHDSHITRYKAYLRGVRRAQQWRDKYKNDPEFALAQRLRTQMRKKAKLHPKLDDLMRDALNRNGKSPTIAEVCGYTIAELRIHLERQFTGDMSWAEFRLGHVHIDHIVPQASFDMSRIEDVRACWALPNLRPLWATDNLAKGARRLSLV